MWLTDQWSSVNQGRKREIRIIDVWVDKIEDGIVELA